MEIVIKFELEEQEAISECKELCAEIEEAGMSKSEFLNTVRGKRWVDKKYLFQCPLCEYGYGYYTVSRPGVCCPKCPLVKQFGKSCFKLGFDEDKRCPKFWASVRKLK